MHNKSTLSFLILSLILTFSTSVFAQRNIPLPANTNVLLRIPYATLSTLLLLDTNPGTLKMKEIYQNLSLKTGFNPLSDIEEILFAAYIPDSSSLPEFPPDFLIVIKADYDMNKLLSSINADKSLDVEHFKIAGHYAIQTNPILCAVFTEKSIIAAPRKFLTNYVENLSNENISADINETLAINGPALFLDMNAGIRKLLSEIMPKNQIAENILGSISKLRLSHSENQLRLIAGMNDEGTAAGIHQMIQSALAMATAQMDLKVNKMQDDLEAMSPIKALDSPQVIASLAGISYIRTLVDNLSISRNSSRLNISSPLPDGATMFQSPLFTVGVLASIAIPNFQRARKNAKQRACMANVRTLESAVEMYNMESPVESVMQELNLEKLKVYFSGERTPKCPDSGKYEFVENNTNGIHTEIRCTVHGSIDNMTPLEKIDSKN